MAKVTDSDPEGRNFGALPDPISPTSLIPYRAIRPATRSRSLVLPDAVDNVTPLGGWNGLGNTGDKSFGDCQAAAWANMRRIVNSKLGRDPYYPTFNQVVDLYRTGTKNENFDPNGSASGNGPNSSSDNGMILSSLLSHLKNDGGPDGVKAVAYCAIQQLPGGGGTNLDYIKEAIAIFGCIWVGCNVFKPLNETQDTNNAAWTMPDGDVSRDSYVSHAVIAGGYDSMAGDVKVVTWGRVNRWSEQYCTETRHIADALPPFDSTRGLGDAYIVIWPEYFGTRTFMQGVDLQYLKDEYIKITNAKDFVFPTALSPQLYYFDTSSRDQKPNCLLQHVSQEDSYQGPIYVNGPLPLSNNDGANSGIVLIDNSDLYYFHTKNTSTNSLELFRARLQNNYSSWDVLQRLSWDVSSITNGGVIDIDNGDIFLFESTNNNSSIKVSNLTTASGWKNSTVSGLDTGIHDRSLNARYLFVRSGYIYVVITDGPEVTGKVMIGKIDFLKGGSARSDQYTAFDTTEDENGTWQMALNGDLILIKTKNCDTQYVEVHVATAVSGYANILYYTTSFLASNYQDPSSGSWHM